MNLRVTKDDIEDFILSEHYFTARDGRRGALIEGTLQEVVDEDFTEDDLRNLDKITYCTIVLKNGFVVTGTSAVLDMSNFSAEIGRDIARDDAINQIGPLIAFALLNEA